MITFSYTINLQLRELLRQIDILRVRILTFPLPPKSEQKFSWEATAIRIWATLALSGRHVPKQEIATILAHSIKPTKAVQTIYALRDTYTQIHTAWRGNPKPITAASWEQIFSSSFPLVAPKEVFSYLEAESEHPVVQAALAHAYVSMHSEDDDAGITACLIHYLLLTKYGYDLRGYIAPESVWYRNLPTYRKLMRANRTTQNLNLWLEFMVETMHDHLETIYENIKATRFYIEFPEAFWSLTERQKEIMKLLDKPEATITNRLAQKHFHISQITASRDLAKLATLGIIYPHGKGRSIYYTKI